MFYFTLGTSGKSYNYGEQSYQTNQFNTFYGKEPSIPYYGKYNQDQPQFSFDSSDSYIAPGKFDFPYSTTSKPHLLYGSTENYVTPNAPRFLYSSAQSYAPPNSPQIAYGPSETYVDHNKFQSLYGLTGTYASAKSPEFSYGSTESYATTSKPKFFYESSESYSTTSRPQFSFGSSESYSSTSKPQFSYESSESYSSTIKPQFPYIKTDAYVTPNYQTRLPNFDLNNYRQLGVLYHQHHGSEIDPQRNSGILLHQQNNFQSIPINKNYDSHKNDVQYPPIKDYETYSTTQGPLNKIPSAKLYSESYSSSNVYSNPSIPYENNAYKNSYSILGGTNGYDSHKVNEQYQPSYNFETYSTTLKPIAKLPDVPNYSESNIYLKPTSKPFDEYLQGISHSKLSEESKFQYSTTSSPYLSSSPIIDFNDYHISSTTQKPTLHDTSLYKEKFKTQFNFEDYISRLSSHQYPSTTSTVDYTPSVHGNSYDNNFAQTLSTYSSTTPKPSVFYYSSPSPKLPKVNEYSESYGSSLSYPVTTEKSVDYNLPISSTYAPSAYSPSVTPSAYTPTFKPTVDYYTPSSTVTNDDSVFVEELISKLSKNPIPYTYSTSTPKPIYDNYPSQQAGDYIPNDSFNIDEYISKLSESIENFTPKPLYSSTSQKPYVVSYSSNDYSSQPLPTSVYLSSTEEPKTFDHESYSALPVQSTTCKPEASIKIVSPKVPYIPSLESVFSVRPPVTYTQRPEPLIGYSSTASDLINYYHNIHSSLDSAYRSPLPRYYAAPMGNSLYTNNYTLPREYEKDGGHHLHAAYPAYPLKPIVVESVSPELNAEFERYYTAGIRQNLKSEENGKVLVIGDNSPLIVGKLGAQCDCAKKKKPTIVSTTTRTVIENDDDDDDEKTSIVKEVETKTKVVLDEVKKPSNKKLCTRAGLFRDPKQCNKFYSCNWDKWTQKYELSEFKCPIHLAFDENLSACNWPSKGPACSHDTLINYSN